MSDRKDVIAVRIRVPRTVRVLASGLDEANAEAVIKLAVLRRGVENEFYTTAPLGKYADGDTFL